MADLTTLRRSPLAHLTDELDGAGGDRVTLVERPFRTMVSIRVDPDDAAASALADVLGAPLPSRCGEVSTGSDVGVVWCGPDEWLAVSAEPAPARDELVPTLWDALGAARGAVVDVSANRTILELAGDAARDVLEKGCPVDLHPRAFPAGRAVLTTVASIPVVLWHVETGVYRVMPRASFAEYLARWLVDAMAEHRGPLVP